MTEENEQQEQHHTSFESMQDYVSFGETAPAPPALKTSHLHKRESSPDFCFFCER